MDLPNSLPAARAPRSHRRDLWAYAALLAFSLLCFLHVRVTVVDDGFIAHRYAANLVHGYGLVFNPGERVEGISDLSWTLLMTVPQWLGWRPELFALIVGALFASLAFPVAYRTAVTAGNVPPPLAFAVAFIAVANAPFWLMAANGIESGLYALVLVTAFALLLHRRALWAGLVLGFATTLRPESLALVPLALAALAAFTWLETRSSRAAWREVGRYRWLLAPWAAIVLAVLVWRLSYYGQWVPNTVPAKAHPLHLSDLVGSAKYLVRFTLNTAPWLLLPLPALLRKPYLRASVLAAFWLAFQLLLVIANGGDWMPGFRLLNVYLPILVVLSALGLHRLLRSLPVPRYRAPLAAAILALCFLPAAFQRDWTARDGILHRHARGELIGQYYEPPFVQLATALQPVLRPTDIAAPEVLGLFSYMLLPIRMHDWLGLVDSHIAHGGTVFYPQFGKSDPAYSVRTVAPTLFAFDSGAQNLRTFQQKSNGDFGRNYHCWQAVGKPLIVALRRDREAQILPALQTSGFTWTPIAVEPSGTR